VERNQEKKGTFMTREQVRVKSTIRKSEKKILENRRCRKLLKKGSIKKKKESDQGPI